ncbi:MAG: DUF3873 family protein [Paludibacter sp.]|nr:DUF3873 family protein [Paludibacter sp.]
MKSDLNGVSTCKPNKENWEIFKRGRVNFYQYDFRKETGELFSCVALTLQMCRDKRDAWLGITPEE